MSVYESDQQQPKPAESMGVPGDGRFEFWPFTYKQDYDPRQRKTISEAKLPSLIPMLGEKPNSDYDARVHLITDLMYNGLLYFFYTNLILCVVGIILGSAYAVESNGGDGLNKSNQGFMSFLTFAAAAIAFVIIFNVGQFTGRTIIGASPNTTANPEWDPSNIKTGTVAARMMEVVKPYRWNHVALQCYRAGLMIRHLDEKTNQ